MPAETAGEGMVQDRPGEVQYEIRITRVLHRGSSGDGCRHTLVAGEQRDTVTPGDEALEVHAVLCANGPNTQTAPYLEGYGAPP